MMSREKLTTDERDVLERLLRDAGASWPTEQEPHPSTWEIASYVAKELDGETAGHVRVHLLHCEECFEEVLGLERAREGERFWEAIPAYLEAFLEAWRRQPVVLAAASEKTKTIQAKVVDEQGRERVIALEVVVGPLFTPEGEFGLDLRLPPGGELEGKPVTVRLHLGEQTIEWEETVTGGTISITRGFGPGPRPAVEPELLEASLFKSLELRIAEPCPST